MTPRRLLAVVWLGAPLVAGAVPFAFFVGGTLGADTLVAAMRDLRRLFVPFVGVVLTYVYRTSRSGGPDLSVGRPTTVAAAVALGSTTQSHLDSMIHW